jgi:ElaB/YqjD/DUF883 family membrane-anchored ribosome-binding protein
MENARPMHDNPSAQGTDTSSTGTSGGSDFTGGSGSPGAAMADRTHEAVDRVADAAHVATEQLSSHADELMLRARDFVREKPFTAVGIALAAGFVLSRLSR